LLATSVFCASAVIGAAACDTAGAGLAGVPAFRAAGVFADTPKPSPITAAPTIANPIFVMRGPTDTRLTSDVKNPLRSIRLNSA
jgi:hypothetical protein